MKIFSLALGGGAVFGVALLATGASAAPMMATGLSAGEVAPERMIVETQGRRYTPRGVSRRGPARGVVVRRGGRGIGPAGAAAIGLGVLGAAAAIGAATAAPSECWLERRPVHDAWGNFLGYRNIRVCN